MKVVHVLSRSHGGIRRHVTALVKELEYRGVSTSVIAPTGTITSRDIHLFEYPEVNKLNILSILQAKNAIHNNISGANVVHAHGLTAAMLCIFALKKQIPIILTLHNLIGAEESKRKRPIFRLLYRYIFSHVQLVIYPSQYARERSLVHVPSSVTILPYQQPIAQAKRDSTRGARLETRKANAILETDIVYCCIARIHPQKNLLMLVNAFAKVLHLIPRAKLVIIGSGSEKEEMRIKERCQQLHIDERVRLMGYIEQPYDLLSASDIFILTSPSETVPFVALEALQCGIPVIMSDTGVAQEILHDACGSYFSVNDFNDCVRQMCQWSEYISNKNDIKYREQISDSFMSQDKCIDPLIEQYERISSEHEERV